MASIQHKVCLIALSLLAATCSHDGGDKTPPTVSLTYPLDGFTVSDTVVVRAEASDNIAVAFVEFYLDGTRAVIDSTSPWGFTWDCRSTGHNTQHSIYAKAYDAAGNSGTSVIASVTVENQTEVLRGLGFVALPDDQYAAIPLAVSPVSGPLPSRVDLSVNFPVVGNQGGQGSCVGWAVGYALKSYQESVERGWDLTADNHKFSASFIYNQIRAGTNCQTGTLISDALNLLKSQGCATLASCQYDPTQCSRSPSAMARQEAANYQIEYWQRVDYSDPRAVKSQLAGGFPVVVGILVYANFHSLESNEIYSSAQGPFLSGHAVCVVGYDDNKAAYKIINSWGTSWSDRGFGWIAYSFLPTVCLEAYVAKDRTASYVDVTPPAAVSDLAANSANATSVTLAWTATGDDGYTGTATAYDVRYSTSMITESNWNSATPASGEPIPKPAGGSESFLVSGLSANTTYHFALKTRDEVPTNWSGLSNVASRKTEQSVDVTAPAPVTDLAAGTPTTSSIPLTWTAPGDDGNTGTAAGYDVRYSTSMITESNWNSATPASGEPIPKPVGESESFLVSGLSANTTYYFALKTRDEVYNWSGLSNQVNRRTQPPADAIAPGDVTTLAAGSETESSIRLTWTSPGDDGYTGTATEYDVRYSTSTITESNWNAATSATGEPTPKSAGNAESFMVPGLSGFLTYYFALKARDEAFNWSGISNVAKATTVDVIPPDSVNNLTAASNSPTSVVLTWTSPGDDHWGARAATEYDIRYATSMITESSWPSATQITGEPSPQIPGNVEVMEVKNLAANTLYYFALKTSDEVPNWSSLSNVASTRTGTTGPWSPLGTGMNNGVRCLSVYNGQLVAGGDFTTAGGVAADHIAVWNGSSWSALGLGVNSFVSCLAVYSGLLIVGGNFDSAGGQPATHIAAWNGTAWIAIGQGEDLGPHDFTIYDGKLVVGGGVSFWNPNGHRVTSWDGSTWSPLGTPIDDVETLTTHNGKLIAASVYGHVFSWEGSSWVPFNPDLSGYSVWSFATFNGLLVAGGSILGSQGVVIENIATWNGAFWSSLGSGVNDAVTSLAVKDGRLISAGWFTHAGGASANRIAAWDGSTWSPLDSGLNDIAEALVVYDGKVIAGGWFTTAGDVSALRIAAWSP